MNDKMGQIILSFVHFFPKSYQIYNNIDHLKAFKCLLKKKKIPSPSIPFQKQVEQTLFPAQVGHHITDHRSMCRENSTAVVVLDTSTLVNGTRPVIDHNCMVC